MATLASNPSVFSVNPPNPPLPAWISSLTVGSWGTVASDVGDRLYSQQPPTMPRATWDVGGSSGGSQNDLFTSSTGASYDPVRNEYLMVANGGHSNYAGNEAYALALWSDAPYWYRLCDPTPNDPSMLSISDSVDIDGYAKYADGRSRAMKTAGFPCYVNGKVWFAFQNAYESRPGLHGFGVCSFNREYAGMPTSKLIPPLGHTGGAGPWEFYSATSHPSYTDANTGVYSYGYSAYDPGTGLIWSIGAGGSTGLYWSTDPTTGVTTYYNRAGGFDPAAYQGPSFWVACPDRGIIIRGTYPTMYSSGGPLPRATEISVFYPSTGTWVDIQTGPALPSNAPFSGYRCGAVYHNGVVYIMEPGTFGSKIFQLALPYDLGGLWDGVWTVLEVGGGPPVGDYRNPWGTTVNGTYTKLQLAKFGTVAALVIPVGWSSPTYVFRLS